MRKIDRETALSMFYLELDGSIRWKTDWFDTAAGERIKTQTYVKVMNDSYDVRSIRKILEEAQND